MNYEGTIDLTAIQNFFLHHLPNGLYAFLSDMDLAIIMYPSITSNVDYCNELYEVAFEGHLKIATTAQYGSPSLRQDRLTKAYCTVFQAPY